MKYTKRLTLRMCKILKFELVFSTVTSSDAVILSLTLSSTYSTFNENCTHFYLFHTFLRDNVHTVTQNFEVLGHTNSCVPLL
jgi:hypothetical protein